METEMETEAQEEPEHSTETAGDVAGRTPTGLIVLTARTRSTQVTMSTTKDPKTIRPTGMVHPYVPHVTKYTGMWLDANTSKSNSRSSGTVCPQVANSFISFQNPVTPASIRPLKLPAHHSRVSGFEKSGK